MEVRKNTNRARAITGIFVALFALVFMISASGNALALEKKSAKGIIQSVDPAAKTFTLKERKKELTIVADDNTKVKMGKEVRTFGDLQNGEKVKVRYREENGRFIADTIHVEHHGKIYEKGEVRG